MREGDAMARAAKSMPRKSSGSSGSAGSGVARSDSTSPAPRDRVGNYPLVGLIQDWDNDERVRDRVRDDHDLVMAVRVVDGKDVLQDGYVEGNIPSAKANHMVLEPLLERMAANDRLLPNLDNLIQVIDAFYRKCKKIRTLEHAYQQSWALRRLIQVVKMACYKLVPPEDSR